MKRKHSRRHQLSVRRVTSELSARLEVARKKRAQSLNQTVLDLLSEAVGLGAKPWTDRYTRATTGEARELDRAVKAMRKVNPRDWE